MAVEPIRVHPMRVAAFGEHRQQRGDAEFGRLLHHEVGGIALQQRERQPEIGFRCLGSRPVLDAQAGAVAPDGLDAGAELAVAAVEQQHRVARPAAHDVPQIMRLRGGCGDGAAFGQRRGDVKAD